ncbi:MAG: hypothetical protein U0132_01275 [Gemmatimonadaceae bacterium]
MAQRLALAVGLAGLWACAPVPASTSPRPAAVTAAPQESGQAMIAAGLGSLKQDDIGLRVSLAGLDVRAIPLDESIIRTLSPDSYRSLHELVVSQRSVVTTVERRTGFPTLSLWYVSFFGTEQGEVRFSPMEMVVTSVGRDFRPLEVVPLTPGFGSQRLRQRESQSALYIFEGQVDVNQPLSLQYETAVSQEWPQILERIERERVLIRSRARARPAPKGQAGASR